MFNDYQIPAIAIIAALLLAFAYLHLRFRSVRTLLWLMALACTEAQAVLVWFVFHHPDASALARTSMSVVGESALMLSSALFLGSLSSLSFYVGRLRILFVVPYTVPLLLYFILYYGISQHPTEPLLGAFIFLAYFAAGVAFLWSLQGGNVPIYIAAPIVGSAILVTIPYFLRGDVYGPILLVQSANTFMTALLVLFVYRRFSPGVLLATAGFILWALPPFVLLQMLNVHYAGGLMLSPFILLGKVFVAMGLILIVLEDEVEKNQNAQRREHRVRLELEAYARQSLTGRGLEEFDRGASQICSIIVQHSRFAGAAIAVRGGTGIYMMVGYAGMDGAMAGALDALVQRLPASFFSPGGATLVPGSASLLLDLAPWLAPGDDLERLRLTRIGAVPMIGPSLGPENSPDGALLLTAPREPLESLRADDLLPLEIFSTRLQAARNQAMMLGKLIDSERFAGVGQLATNLAQQLNNPLTVILGYSALLEESTASAPAANLERRGVEAISTEARRMKAILERLSRFSRLNSERFNAFSLADLIGDIEQLHRTDFLRHSIEFRVALEPGIPNIVGNPHQLRQALLHVTQFAMESVLRLDPNEAKAIRIEAKSPVADGQCVQVLIGHSGPGFANPERAFDTLSAGFSSNDPAAIALGLCAAIVREHRGSISARNYQPKGAVVTLDLPVS